MSTGMGSVDIFEQQIEKSSARGPRAVSPYFVPGVMPNGAAALIAMRYGLMGPSYSLASACATGTHSIATSALMIEAGDADLMVAGGAEAATRLNTVAGFGNARALGRAGPGGDPTKVCRPFDKAAAASSWVKAQAPWSSRRRSTPEREAPPSSPTSPDSA
jgi:3-oxoacyl-[acyl-carrier-protein] synthase II